VPTNDVELGLVHTPTQTPIHIPVDREVGGDKNARPRESSFDSREKIT